MRLTDAGSSLGSIDGTSAVEVVPPPGSTAARVRRSADLLTFTNLGTSTRTLTLRFKDTNAAGGTQYGTIFRQQVPAGESWEFPGAGKAIRIDRRTRSIEALLDAAGTFEFTSSWEDYT